MLAILRHTMYNEGYRGVTQVWRYDETMKASTKKICAAMLLIIATLLLSGCYVETEDTVAGGSNVNAGNNTMPFNTIAPANTTAPTATPTATPSTTGGSNIGNVDWDNNGAWGETATATSGVSGNIVTMPPSLGQTGNTTQTTAAPTKTASVTSAPATSGSLKAGSQGSEVSDIQQRLKDLKYYTGTMDGKFGSGTTNAVKAFQEANGLKADGVVGDKTKEQLFSYYAVAYSGSTPINQSTSNPTAKPTTKATATPKPTATPNTDNARVLEIGKTGSDVRQVQNRLIELGYMTGKADGSYGDATAAAVSAFQKNNKLWEDGKAGPETQKVLFSSSAKKGSSAASYLGDTLEMGAEGDAVRALQNQLIKLKYMSGYSDGSYGEKTKSAVENFQRNNGLTVDGKAGKTTLAKLYASDAVDANGKGGSSSSGSGDSTGYTTLQEGDEGASVKKLQERLKELGYYSGSVDGKFGSGTLTAVRAFQEAMKLTVDGKAGSATQRALYGTNAKPEDTTKTLELGSEGSAVTKLQRALYELGYYQAKINGIYNQDTANAVREFQMINKLTVDGKAGTSTQNVLYSSSAKPAAAETSNYKTLKIGSKGNDVVEVQLALRSLGYLDRSSTGEYDQETADAIKSFQQRNGLSVDGDAGPETQEKLFSSSAVRAN